MKTIFLTILALLSLFTCQGSTQLTCSFGFVSNGTHCEECGISEFTQNTEIPGESVATPHSWPWAVYIVQNVAVSHKFPDGQTHLITRKFTCSGTLVSRSVVVTSARCIKKQFEHPYNGTNYTIPVTVNSYYPTWSSMFTLYFGAHDISQLPISVTPPIVSRKFSSLIIRSGYSDTIAGDVPVVLVLDVPIEFNSCMKPACLPKNDYTTIPASVESVGAIGWGGTFASSEPGSRLLQNVLLTVYDSSHCELYFPKVTSYEYRYCFCSGLNSEGKETCHGELGGGVFSKDKTAGVSRQILSGIFAGCIMPSYPAVNTRVSYYLDWIKSYIVSTTPAINAANTTTSISSTAVTTAKVSSTSTRGTTATTSTTYLSSVITNTVSTSGTMKSSPTPGGNTKTPFINIMNGGGVFSSQLYTLLFPIFYSFI